KPGETTKENLLYAGRAISFTIGIPVDHVVLVRSEAFIAGIDAIGGVDVDVPSEISDPRFPNGAGGYGRVHVAQGLQHLDGESALKYVRTRVAPEPGFDRGSRQRQIVLNAFERITQQNLMPELIKQAPSLWRTASGSIETTLSVSDVIDLALSTTALSQYDIALADLEECQLMPDTAGDSPVQPAAPVNIRELIKSLLEKME
ncbi:MAG: LCP family protein, partial [Anaerolineae bacterium]|nr:LCP family protein [Anaerolineae bacterium]